MRFRVRNEPDVGPATEGAAVVTYSRLSRGRRGEAERQEPVLEAREVPYVDGDLRAFDPERAADDLDRPKRGSGRRRRGGFGAVLIGTLALAAGMVILAYAYGVATRVDAPTASSAGASASAPAGADTLHATLPADDAARSIPAPGVVPAARVPAEAAQPPAATHQAAREPAAAPVTGGSDGQPMDGDFALPAADGPQPAPVASAPAAGKAVSPPATDIAKPRPSKAASAPPADKTPADKKPAAAASVDSKPAAGKPADGTDDLIANIEKLLQRDGATVPTPGQPAVNPVAPAGPTSIVPAQPAATADPGALPPLPDPNAAAARTPLDNRLLPPADIPNVPAAATGTGLQ